MNFPEGAVQRATDDYVKELYRSKKASSTPTSFFQFNLIQSVHAANPIQGFELSSLKIKAIQAKQKTRLTQIIEYKKKGYIGETKEGFVVARKEATSLSPLLKRKVLNAIQAENSDRKDLYLAALDSNGFPKTKLNAIQLSFARSFQAESPSGTWLEDADGNWTRKP